MGPQAAHAGFHWRIWSAEAAGTALMVLAIVAVAALALGASSPVAVALPGRGARFLVLGTLVAPCARLDWRRRDAPIGSARGGDRGSRRP